MLVSAEKIAELEKKARKLRYDVVMIIGAGKPGRHLGGSCLIPSSRETSSNSYFSLSSDNKDISTVALGTGCPISSTRRSLKFTTDIFPAAHPAFYQSVQFKAHPGAAYTHAVREELHSKEIFFQKIPHTRSKNGSGFWGRGFIAGEGFEPTTYQIFVSGSAWPTIDKS